MNKCILLLLIAFFSLGLNAFYLFGSSSPEKKNFSKENPESSSVTAQNENPFVSKRVFLNKSVDYITSLKSLRLELHQYLSKVPVSENISIYFEYLPTGSSVTIREKEEVRLSSLGKVQTVMAVYKKVEQGELDEGKEIVIKESQLNKEYGTLWKKGANSKVTVGEAVRLALTESDNTAHNVLLSLVSNDELNQVYETLDIPFYKIGEFPAVSAKNYSSVMRNLYFSSYLFPTYSNKILSLLTETIYTDKIVSGVPREVKVAHKVGMAEHVDTKDSSFSDCGIVYADRRPYILCVVIKSVDQPTANTYFKEISELLYKQVLALTLPEDRS